MAPVLPTPSRRTFVAGAGALGAAALFASARRVTAADPPLAPPDKQPPNLKLPEVVGKRAGYAIVGLGELALAEILPAFALARLARPVALVSGHPDKAKAVAAGYGINPKAIYTYDTFDTIVDNPEIDVVYVVLPNSMHGEFTVRGLKAGKHVLCEKPMAPTTEECRKMIAAAQEMKRKLMIAYRLHYEPFNRKAIELCRGGEVGTVKLVTASNGQNTKAPNIRLSKALGGGPVGDVGIYCLNAARYLTGEEPTEVTAMLHQPKDDPRFREVPESGLFTVRFPSGAVANCDCSFGTAETRRFQVAGTEGVIDLENAFGYRGQRLFVGKGGKKAELKIDPVNHFAAEMDHFADCVMHDRPCRTPGEEGLADMRVIETINEAAASGRTVAIKR